MSRSPRQDRTQKPWQPELPGRADKAIAPKALSLDRSLSPAAKAVGANLVDRFNRQTGRCDPSVRRLAKDTGYSRRAIFGALKELEDAGIIRRQRHGGGSQTNAYAINWALLRKPWPNNRVTDEENDTGTGAETIPSSGAEGCTQTLEPTIEKEPWRAGTAGDPLRRAEQRRTITQDAGKWRWSKRRLRSMEVMRNKALQRWERDLRNNLGMDAYAEVITRLTDELIDRATKAEIARPGTEYLLVLGELS